MREGSLGVPLIRSVDEAAAEQIEVCPAKHVAFHHFQANEASPQQAAGYHKEGHCL
jgi:hypothetical protein